jgi:hypothetical protein
MKKNLILFGLGSLLFFTACQKEETLVTAQNSEENLWKFQKEITLKNGDNTVFVTISSIYEDSLKIYLEGINLELSISTEKSSEQLKTLRPITNDLLIGSKYREVKGYEPSVKMEITGTNIQSEYKLFSISVGPKNLKSSVQPLPIASLETTKDFIGIKTENDGGYELWCKFIYKSHWYSFWTNVSSLSENACFAVSRPGIIYRLLTINPYKFRAVIYREIGDPVYPQYTYSFEVDNFQALGTNCLIGSYDGDNCYLGQAPAGTSVFIYSGNFYYTPVNGNQCPLLLFPESRYDGENCYVTHIPDHTNPFILNNSWYVTPYLTSDLF